jgi:hypothetical protein
LQNGDEHLLFQSISRAEAAEHVAVHSCRSNTRHAGAIKLLAELATSKTCVSVKELGSVRAIEASLHQIKFSILSNRQARSREHHIECNRSMTRCIF